MLGPTGTTGRAAPATVVLSYAAALDVSVALFDALGLTGTDPSVPLYAFFFLVALGVDYNIFLMTRIRVEAFHAGTLRGLAVTGGATTSAGLVLAATFNTLAVLPWPCSPRPGSLSPSASCSTPSSSAPGSCRPA